MPTDSRDNNNNNGIETDQLTAARARQTHTLPMSVRCAHIVHDVVLPISVFIGESTAPREREREEAEAGEPKPLQLRLRAYADGLTSSRSGASLLRMLMLSVVYFSSLVRA